MRHRTRFPLMSFGRDRNHACDVALLLLPCRAGGPRGPLAAPVFQQLKQLGWAVQNLHHDQQTSSSRRTPIPRPGAESGLDLRVVLRFCPTWSRTRIQRDQLKPGWCKNTPTSRCRPQRATPRSQRLLCPLRARRARHPTRPGRLASYGATSCGPRRIQQYSGNDRPQQNSGASPVGAAYVGPIGLRR